MIEKVGAAIGAELVRQELAGEDFDEAQSNAALARVAIEALREPSEAMLAAGISCPRMAEVGNVLVFAATHGVQIRDEEPWPLQAAWSAMITAAIQDSPQ